MSDDGLIALAWQRLSLLGPQAAAALLELHAISPADLAARWLDLAEQGRGLGAIEPAAQALAQAIGQGVTGDAAVDGRIGHLLAWLGRDEAALNYYRRALEVGEDAGLLLECGALLVRLNRIPEAVAPFRRAVALRPEWALAHANLGMALLYMGCEAEGWAEYEWRRRLRPVDAFEGGGCPAWTGEPLAGGSLLVSGEQGFGDALQFARYLPALARRCDRLLVAVRRPLARLFRFNFGAIAEVLTEGDAIPRPDRHMPLMSAPLLLAGDAPAPVPYLRADPARAEQWRQRLAPLPGRRVGLCWTSAGGAAGAALKCLPPDALAPLASVAGVSFVSLQPEPPSGVLPVPVLDVSDELRDFQDTAALIDALDATISVDTAVLHLAGALGRPGCGLLPFSADWRWSPEPAARCWYPNLFLSRQPVLGEWLRPVQAVCHWLDQ